MLATPPVIQKQFLASTVKLNGSVYLAFSIQNPNPATALTVSFTDNLPAGLQVGPSAVAGNCNGTVSAAAGSSTISLNGGSVPASTTCNMLVDIKPTTVGVKNNSVSVTAVESGPGNTSFASITVVGPPTIVTSFGTPSIPLNGTTTLNFSIFNNNNATTTLTGIGVGDTLPAGLQIATPNGLSASCQGGTITANPGSTAVQLSGAFLFPAGTCTFSVNVVGVGPGLQTNQTGNVFSVEGGTGGSATATLKVEGPPVTTTFFSPASIARGSAASLIYDIQSPPSNPDPLTGVAFTDTLPLGLTVASASATVCGGTVTTTSPRTIALAGGTTPCGFAVTVTGATNGPYSHSTGPVSSTNGGASNVPSVAYLAVSFGSPSITSITPNHGPTFGGGPAVSVNGSNLGGVSSITFGPNTAKIVSVSDTSIIVYPPSNAAGPVNVVATNPGGNATSSNGYTYDSCTATLTSSGIAAPATGMSGSFGINTQPGCAWQADGAPSFVSSSDNGSDSGTVSFVVAANTDVAGRVGTVSVAGQAFTITQSGVAPSNLIATAFNNSVSVSWASSAVDHFEIWRNSGSGFVRTGTSASTFFTDFAVAPLSAYVYKVRAVDSKTNTSAFSNNNVATVFTFTDDPLSAGTIIKSPHIMEMRQAVNIVRSLAALSPFPFTDPSVSGAAIKLVHLTDLRTALDAARSALGLPPLTYTPIAVGSAVSANDITQVRNGVK